MATNDILKKSKSKGKGIRSAMRADADMVGDVVDITWPRKLADGVLKNLEKMSGKQISNSVEPKLVGDVLVMC
jgi:hypothetical protein